jgi:hypothetical protein
VGPALAVVRTAYCPPMSLFGKGPAEFLADVFERLTQILVGMRLRLDLLANHALHPPK